MVVQEVHANRGTCNKRGWVKKQGALRQHARASPLDFARAYNLADNNYVQVSLVLAP